MTGPVKATKPTNFKVGNAPVAAPRPRPGLHGALGPRAMLGLGAPGLTLVIR